MPLESVSASGARYRLTSATLSLVGPQEESLSLDGEAGQVTFELAVGSYVAELLDGWVLSRLGAGEPVQVDAELTTANPTSLSIVAGEETELGFGFRVIPPEPPGAAPEPETGDGSLTVTVDIEDEPAEPGACTEPAGGLCAAPLLEALLNAAVDGICIPPQDVPLGPVGGFTMCDEPLCDGGEIGCPLPAPSIVVRTAPAGADQVEVSVQANLPPASIDVPVPAALGGPCVAEISADLGTFTALIDAAVGTPEVVDISPGVLQPTITAGPGVTCAAIPTFAAPFLEQAQQGVSDALTAQLAGALASLACAPCSTPGCELLCTAAP